ncbi:MAG: Stp1/IreP family PP2C-type Ser/Thr phosphatase [Oscillospiraceae bacterium]|nr:Stp1/IreP family PP2C-type Ser/Thr phosphatase [Oscillospiraceae bacterium]
MRIVSKTDIGRVRRSNQDSYAAGESSGSMAWAVVCDGMGGQNGGDIASATAVKIISERIAVGYRDGMGASSIRAMLLSAVKAANIQIFEMSQSVETLRGMGTTVVAAVLCGQTAHIAHAGDSRAYLISGEGLTQLTRDHSVVQSMLEKGELTQDEAKSHPIKNIITRALGVDGEIEADYNEQTLAPDDSILICTDGLTNYVTGGEIMDIVKGKRFYEYPEEMIARANENGGGDNVTVVVLGV